MTTHHHTTNQALAASLVSTAQTGDLKASALSDSVRNNRHPPENPAMD
ncbi:MAG TPA: hypothetical protein VGM98_11545 [Schlesneria sp.]|jgi:hypothetical protein